MSLDSFTHWKSWGERDQIAGIKFPGVYALAISLRNLSGTRFSLIKEIAYFGMTNSAAGLKGRLKQFDNTIRGKSGHGGADRFRNDHEKYEDLAPFLYVSVMPFKCNVTSNRPKDLLVMGRVAKAEYDCWAQYAATYKSLPKYNDKKTASKFSAR